MSRFQLQPIVFSASPRANLLPDAQYAEQNHQRTLPKLLLVLLSSVVVAALISLAGFIPLFLENQKLEAAEAESERLMSEIAEYSETQTTMSTVKSLAAERETLMAEEVLLVPLYDQVSSLVPVGASLEFFSATLGNSTVAPVSSTFGAGVCAVGATSIQVTISSPERATVLGQAAQLATDVSALPGYVCSEVTEVKAEPNSAPEASGDIVRAKIMFTFDETVHADRFVGGVK